MWQPQSMRWFLITLGLLAACSQTTPLRSMSEASSPIATKTDAPAALSSATAPASQLVADHSSGQAPSSIAPASVNTVRTQAPLTANSIAAHPVVKPLDQSSPEPIPTFQATPRMVGFSPDSNYFIYLESSRDTGAGVPQAALQLVNVAANRCVENGCIETRYGEEAGTKTSAAENNLLQQTWKVRQDLNLTPPVTGTDLPILSRSRSADGSETVMVQPTTASQPLQLHLRQKKASDKAAMQLEVNYNGQERSLDSLSNFRTHVLAYAIRQVTLSPDGKRVAVLITTTKPTFEGTLGTTLVQGFGL